MHHDTLQIQSENHPKFVQLKTEILVSLNPKIIDSGFLIRCEAPDGRKMDEGRGRREVKESGTVLFYGSLKNNYSHTHELIHTHTHTLDWPCVSTAQPWLPQPRRIITTLLTPVLTTKCCILKLNLKRFVKTVNLQQPAIFSQFLKSVSSIAGGYVTGQVSYACSLLHEHFLQKQWVCMTKNQLLLHCKLLMQFSMWEYWSISIKAILIKLFKTFTLWQMIRMEIKS